MDVDDIFGKSQSLGEAFLPKVHIRIQQRNGRKCQTLVQGLTDANLNAICKEWRNIFHANGSIDGEVIIMQGDHRMAAKKWIVDNKLSDEENIIIHG